MVTRISTGAIRRQGSGVFRVCPLLCVECAIEIDLERAGAMFVDDLSEVPDGANVVFSAHGVSPEVRSEAARRGLVTVDATSRTRRARSGAVAWALVTLVTLVMA